MTCKDQDKQGCRAISKYIVYEYINKPCHVSILVARRGQGAGRKTVTATSKTSLSSQKRPELFLCILLIFCSTLNEERAKC